MKFKNHGYSSRLKEKNKQTKKKDDTEINIYGKTNGVLQDTVKPSSYIFLSTTIPGVQDQNDCIINHNNYMMSLQLT